MSFLQYSEKIKSFSYILLPFLGIFLVWAYTPYLLSRIGDKGEHGDMYGAINALFSGLAFAGLLTAIFLQRKELQLQSQSLVTTQEELRYQLAEFKEQNETLKRQRFENTFFQMLSLHNEIVGSMVVNPGTKYELKGRQYFESLVKAIYDNFKDPAKERNHPEPCGRLIYCYEQMYNGQQSSLGHYFRWLYRMVLFVHTSCDVDDKKFYTNMIRAQLSNQELQLLFANCLSNLGKKNFKKLIEEYALLNNLAPDGLIDLHKLTRRYAVGAYGDAYPF